MIDSLDLGLKGKVAIVAGGGAAGNGFTGCDGDGLGFGTVGSPPLLILRAMELELDTALCAAIC